MYEAFYGLQERPFSLTPDPRFLYLSSGHREALSNLTYGVSAGYPITVLVGEAGTGKTTLLRSALASLQPDARYVVVSNSTLTRSEFVQFLAARFELSPAAAASKSVWLIEFEQMLRDRHARGLVTALLVDEAQSLPDALLEEVRLLSNIETDSSKLLPIVLIGQPELADRLNHTELRQLKQRIALRCELHPFDLSAAAGYIASRIRVAGGIPGRVFTKEAVAAIFDASHGIARTINVLCENALLSGFAAGVKPVDSSLVHEVCGDFQFLADDRPSAGSSPSGALIRALPPSNGNGGEAAVVEDPKDLFGGFSQPRRLSLFGLKQ